MKIVLSALTKTGEYFYTICMKTQKLPLAVIFGLLFSLAGNRAFAGQAYDQLIDASKTGGFEDTIKLERGPANDTLTQNKAAAAPLTNDTKAAAPVTRDATAAAATPPPPPAPTLMDFVGEHKTQIVMGAVGAYMGFALLGPIGLLIGAILVLGFMKVAEA